jgi:hypothetical protein
MKKYRFKTKEEFITDDLWDFDSHIIESGYPKGWNNVGQMNIYLGKEIDLDISEYMKNQSNFQYQHLDDPSYSTNNPGWLFKPSDVTEIEELTLEELRTKMNLILNNK